MAEPLNSLRKAMLLHFVGSALGPAPFPDIDWTLPFSEETVRYVRGGLWWQEAGQYRDMAEETEAIRDYGLLAIFSNWNGFRMLSVGKRHPSGRFRAPCQRKLFSRSQILLMNLRSCGVSFTDWAYSE